MITKEDFSRLMKSIKARIYNMINKAVIQAVDDTAMIQTLKIQVSPEELFEGVERQQPYGFESKPTANDECLVLSMDGTKNKAVVINVMNKQFRVKTLQSGEVCLYCKDSANGTDNQVLLKPDGTIHIKNYLGTYVKLTSTNVEVNGNTKSFVTYTELNTALQLLIGLLSGHVHTSAAPGAPTSTPTGPITCDISAAESQKAKTG